MKTHDFDRRMRVLAGQEVFAMSKESENRLRQALHSPQIRPAARRLSLRAVLVTALILALCGGIAVAATVWGLEMLLRQPEGKTVLPVNESVQSEALKLEIIDAVFDGKAIALAWTMENRLDEPVYLLSDRLTINGESPDGGTAYNVEAVFVEPGEILQAGFLFALAQEAQTVQECVVDMAFSALLPTGEVVDIGGIAADAGEAGAQDYLDRIDRLIAEGKVPVAGDGYIEMGSANQTATGATYAEQLVNAGLAEAAEGLEVSLTLKPTVQTVSALPDGQPVEQAFKHYTLRVTRCELTPLTVEVQLERVFADKAALEAYAPYYSEKMGPAWTYEVLLDGTTLSEYTTQSGGNLGTPQEQPDGSWIWPYEIIALEPQSTFMPATVEIIACRDTDDAYDVPIPEESITLTLP